MVSFIFQRSKNSPSNELGLSTHRQPDPGRAIPWPPSARGLSRNVNVASDRGSDNPKLTYLKKFV
jgi:hypothetical protein